MTHYKTDLLINLKWGSDHDDTAESGRGAVSDPFKTGPVSRTDHRNHDDHQNEEGWP